MSLKSYCSDTLHRLGDWLENLWRQDKAPKKQQTDATEDRLLAMSIPTWRTKVVFCALVICLLIVVGKAAWLQCGIQTDFLKQQGEVRYAHTIAIPAERGRILDRNGQVLASTVQVRCITVNPSVMGDVTDEQWRQLAHALGKDWREIKKKVRDRKDRRFYYLDRQASVEAGEAIRDMKIHGVHVENDMRRYYPDGEVSAHIVGFTDIDNQGKEGMELAENEALTGKEGKRRVIRDRLGRVVEDVWAEAATLGSDIVLSIDARLQYTAFDELKKVIEKHEAKAGAVMVADVHTGEILAMANWPTFDPNSRRSMKMDSVRNRVLTDMFEPGSTMKPFAVAKALDMGIVRPDTLIPTSPGWMIIGDKRIGDNNHDYGTLTVSEVISKSSNIGTTLIAREITPETLWNMYSDLGFGQSPNVGLPGATRGRLHPHAKWGPVEHATISYGHGVSVSLAQMVQAYTALARHGDVIDLTIKKTDRPAEGRPVFRPEIARQMRQMMMNTVKVGGTARSVSVQGYTVAGKTGTANKLENGRYVRKFVSSFIGIAPATQPRLVVAVMIDEPTKGSYYGGTVTASAFNAVTSKALSLIGEHPDDPAGAAGVNVFVRGKMND